MKKFISVFTVFILLVFSLLSCSPKKTYDDGFEDGYSEASSKYEDHYSRGVESGYDIGYDEGYATAEADHEKDILNAVERACRYASYNSEWGLYEALQIVGVRQGFMSLGDGSEMPTDQEYTDAIKTLYLFCEFFDSEKYDTSAAMGDLTDRIDEIVREGG